MILLQQSLEITWRHFCDRWLMQLRLEILIKCMCDFLVFYCIFCYLIPFVVSICTSSYSENFWNSVDLTGFEEVYI